MKRFFAISMILMSPVAMSQDLILDAKGEFIYGLPSVKFNPTITGKNVAIQAPLPYFRKIKYYVMDNGTKRYTYEQTRLAFIKVSLNNNTKSALMFNAKTNVSPRLEFGFAKGFESLQSISATSEPITTISGSIFADYQNFKYYDQVAKTYLPEKTNRVSPGIKFNYSWLWQTRFAISASVTYSNAIVTDDLTSYQDRTNTFYVDDKVASNGQVDGYLLPAEPTNNLRFSLALPQFWTSGRLNEVLPFFVTPYGYILLKDGSDATYNAGVTVTLMKDRFFKFDRDENGNLTNSPKYEFVESLSIGYNAFSNSKKDPTYIFISGSLNIGKFFPKRDTIEKPN